MLSTFGIEFLMEPSVPDYRATCEARCPIAVGCIIDGDCSSTKCDTVTALAGTDAAGPDLCLSRFGALVSGRSPGSNLGPGPPGAVKRPQRFP